MTYDPTFVPKSGKRVYDPTFVPKSGKLVGGPTYTPTGLEKLPTPIDDPTVRSFFMGGTSSPKVGAYSPGAEFKKPWEYTSQDFMSSPVGQFAQKQAPALNEALLKEQTQGSAERFSNVAGQAGAGVGMTAGGMLDMALGALAQLNPADERSVTQKADQFFGGLNKTIGGVVSTATSPLALSPVLQKGAGLPFEAMRDVISQGVAERGIDPESEHGKAIVDSFVNGITMAVIGPKKITKGITDVLDTGMGMAKQAGKDIQQFKTADILKKREEVMRLLEEKNTKVRKAIEDEAKFVDKKTGLPKNDPVKDLINSDELVHSVNKDGRFVAKKIKQDIADYIEPREGRISKILKEEGKTVSLKEVEARMKKAVEDSGAKMTERITELNRVKTDIEGLKLDADAKGNIPLEVIHQAKINKGNSAYESPAAQTTKRFVTNELKQIIEENSSHDVAGMNAELSRYYAIQGLVEAMDGAKITSGGKFIPELIGTATGFATGSVLTPILGPLAPSAGAVAGAAVGGALKNISNKGTFGGETGLKLPQKTFGTPSSNVKTPQPISGEGPGAELRPGARIPTELIVPPGTGSSPSAPQANAAAQPNINAPKLDLESSSQKGITDAELNPPAKISATDINAEFRMLEQFLPKAKAAGKETVKNQKLVAKGFKRPVNLLPPELRGFWDGAYDEPTIPLMTIDEIKEQGWDRSGLPMGYGLDRKGNIWTLEHSPVKGKWGVHYLRTRY